MWSRTYSAASRAEPAKRASANATQIETIPESASGATTLARRHPPSKTPVASSRRARRMPAGGINGNTDLALIVQLKNVAKTNVPTTHDPRNAESASFRSRQSANAIPRREIPPATKIPSCRLNGPKPGAAPPVGDGIQPAAKASANAAERIAPIQIFERDHRTGMNVKAVSAQPPTKASPNGAFSIRAHRVVSSSSA